MERRDLDLDTRLGRFTIGAVHDSAAARWRWSFELHYDGEAFADATGATYSTEGLAPGEAIPGTHWELHGASSIATKGGRIHEFGSDGRLLVVRWRNAQYPRLVFLDHSIAGEPRLAEVRQYTDPDTWTPVYSLSHDEAGRLVRIDDRAGRRAEFTWDELDRLVTARDGLDVERGWPGQRYEYDGLLLGSVTSSEGERVEYAYGSGGRLAHVRSVGGESATHQMVYRPAGSGGLYATEVHDPLGGTWVLRYDAARRVREISDPLGSSVAFTWAGKRPASRTDAAGVTVSWLWQGDDLVEEVLPSGNTILLEWEPGALEPSDPDRRALRRATDDLGVLEERSYDALGRLVSAVDGAGDTTSFTWGALGELISITTPDGRVTSFSSYGDHGHPTVVSDAQGERNREYDSVGNLISGDGLVEETSPSRPGIVSRSFDADRNVATVRLAAQAIGLPIAPDELVVEHRSDGRRSRILRPGGGDTEFVYDDRGRLVERRDRADGVWNATLIQRDALDRVVRIDRPNGTWSEFGWNAAGQRDRIAHGRGGEQESSAEIAWLDGRPDSVLDSVHDEPERYVYDDAGRVVAIQFPEGELLQLVWDARSRNREELYWYGSGLLRRLVHDFDGAGRLVESRDGSDLLVRRTWSLGRWTQIETGNGLVRTATYSPEDGLLTGTTTVDAAGTVVETTTFVRSSLPGALPAHTWSVVTTTAGGLAVTSEETHILAPAPGLHLEPGPRASGFEAAGSAGNPVFYSYDALGNWVGSPVRHLVHNPEGNRLLRIEENPSGALLHDYAWDPAGYATRRDDVALHWNAAGRIASIEGIASFEWDSLGRLVSAQVAGVVARQRFGGRVLADAQGNPVAIERQEVRIDLTGSGHRWRHFDFRGNAKFVTDDEGRVIAHRRFAPYGTDALWGDDPDGIGFAQGRELGELVLLGGRLYDPAAGRFLAPDPVFQLVNGFAYAQSNPLWFWDPDGRSARGAITIAAGIGIAGMAVGAVVAGAVATPAAFAIGLGLTLFSAGFAAGVTTPASPTAQAAATALGTLGAGLGGFTAAAAPAGFAIGQALQNAIEVEFGSVLPPSTGGGGSGTSPGGGAGDTGDFGIQIKVVELAFEPPAGAPTPEGCSPVLGASRAPDLGRLLVVLLPLQLWLGWRWLRRSRWEKEG